MKWIAIVLLAGAGLCARRQSAARRTAAQVPAGVRRLPLGVSARHAARRIVEATRMGSLPTHYGTDASLDEASVRDISGWLQTHAGTYKRVI